MRFNCSDSYTIFSIT